MYFGLVPLKAIPTFTLLQEHNARRFRALQPGGKFDELLMRTTEYAWQSAIAVTHVWTGALRASHRMQRTGRLFYEVYIDPTTFNPVTFERPVAYGVVEENRGGDHAFYTNAVDDTRRWLDAQRIADYVMMV